MTSVMSLGVAWVLGVSAFDLLFGVLAGARASGQLTLGDEPGSCSPTTAQGGWVVAGNTAGQCEPSAWVEVVLIL